MIKIVMLFMAIFSSHSILIPQGLKQSKIIPTDSIYYRVSYSACQANEDSKKVTKKDIKEEAGFSLSQNNRARSVARNIRLFPNPANNYINIETNLTITIECMNYFGDMVFIKDVFKGSSRIDISHIPDDKYFIRLRYDKKIIGIVKIIKEPGRQ
jgi:hypothetical protein